MQKTGKSGPHCWGRKGSTQIAQQLESAVTGPPLVCCVVWSPWITQHALSSDHLPIITTINIRHDYKLQQNRRIFTNYKKAHWTQFTEDTESAFSQTTIPITIHTANIIFLKIILMADKHNIPKAKMHSNCRHLPDHKVCKFTQINNINEEITSDIQKHKQNIWKEHLDAHWDHRHIMWKTIHGLSNRAPPPTLNSSITFSNHTQTHSELFHQTIYKHCQTRNKQDKQIHQQSNTKNTRI